MTTAPGSASPPRSSLDPYAPEVLAEPYAFHRQIRDAGPLVWLERYQLWALGRHKEVHAALNDWQTFSSAAGVGISDYRKEKPWRKPSIILEVDPPAHTRSRAVLSRILSRRALSALRAMFDEEAQLLIGRLVAKGSFDGICDLAEVYPLKVFGDAIGLPAHGRENLMLYGRLQLNAFGPRNALYEEAMASSAPILEWVNSICSRAALSPQGLGAQIFDAADGGEISEEEAKMLFRAFLSAGGDTTVNGIGNALYYLASNPEQWKLIREDESNARNAFDEVIRIEPPIQIFFRTAARDCLVADVPVADGDKVMLLLASANRDPRRWQEPDRFDIRRNVTGHVGFGAGIHGCIGQMIARMEGEAVIGALARAVRTLELSGAPVRRLNNSVRGWASLPLAIRAS